MLLSIYNYVEVNELYILLIFKNKQSLIDREEMFQANDSWLVQLVLAMY